MFLEKSILTETLKMFKRNWKTILDFEIMFKLIFFVVFVPIFYGLVKFSQYQSGYLYVTSRNLIGYLTHPLTVVCILIIYFMIVLSTLYDIAGISYIYNRASNGYRVNFISTVVFAYKGLLKLLKPKNALVFFYSVLLLPLIGFGSYSLLLNTFDINKYIEVIIPNIALTIFGLGFLALLFLVLIKYIFVYNIILFDEADGIKAFRLSRIRMKNNNIKNTLTILMIYIVNYVILYLIGSTIIFLVTIVLRLFNDANLAYVIALGFSLTFITILVVLSLLFLTPVVYFFFNTMYYIEKDNYYEIVNVTNFYKEPNDLFIKITRMLNIAVPIFSAIFIGVYVAVVATNNVVVNIDNVTVQAHRGSSLDYPENSMAAFEAAVQETAEYIELDIQQTKDGVLYVMHDRSLKRTTGLDKYSYEVTWDEIKDLSISNIEEFKDQRIPLFSEAIKFAKDNNILLNVELKPTGYEKDFEKSVIDTLEEYNYLNKCVVTSQNYNTVRNLKLYNKECKTAYVTTLIDYNQLKYADVISIRYNYINADLVAKAHQDKKQVYAWTCNSAAIIDKMISLGVDSIITDNVVLAKTSVLEYKSSEGIKQYVRKILNLV